MQYEGRRRGIGGGQADLREDRDPWQVQEYRSHGHDMPPLHDLDLGFICALAGVLTILYKSQGTSLVVPIFANVLFILLGYTAARSHSSSELSLSFPSHIETQQKTTWFPLAGKEYNTTAQTHPHHTPTMQLQRLTKHKKMHTIMKHSLAFSAT